MVAWSMIARRSGLLPQCRNFVFKPNLCNPSKAVNYNQVRTTKSTGGTFNIVTSTFQWNVFKDTFHFYVLLGLIPCTLVVLYCNIFIGPATLKEIPPGYKPKPWEYHPHPISRFFIRYILKDTQKEYEKNLFVLFHRRERELAREVESRVKELIAERRDFQAWYYTPVVTKYTRHFLEEQQEAIEAGHNTMPYPFKR